VRALLPLVATLTLVALPARAMIAVDVYRRVIRAHHGELRSCYQAALEHTPDARGRLSVSFTIDAQGSVTDASIVDDTVGDASMRACILTAIQSWRFPEARDGASITITYPFVFAP
jgi:TonB family protein